MTPRDDNGLLLEEIRELLGTEPAESGAFLTRIENTLTDGYARALALEGERWRLERKLGEVAQKLTRADAAERAEEMAALARNISVADSKLASLRAVLATLRDRAAEVRTAA